MDLKLGWKERAMPHLQQHHPVPQGHHSQPSVDWSPEAHKQSHYNCTASTGPKYTQTLPTQELTSFHVWVWQHHLTTVTPIPHVRNLSSCPTFHTIPAVCSQCSIGPTFDLYHSYEGTWQGSKIIHDKGHAHLTPSHLPDAVSQSKHGPSMPRLNGNNKTHIHTQQLHMPGGTPTSLIIIFLRAMQSLFWKNALMSLWCEQLPVFSVGPISSGLHNDPWLPLPTSTSHHKHTYGFLGHSPSRIAN